MAMMQELLKRPACAPSDDGYHCADRLRNQFLEYHDPYAWYASVYDLREDVEGLNGRQLLAASSTIGGAEDNIAAYWVQQMAAAAQVSPEAFLRAYAAASEAGGKSAEAAKGALEQYIQSGVALTAQATLAILPLAYPETKSGGQTAQTRPFGWALDDSAMQDFRTFADAVREATSPIGPNALAGAVGARGTLPGQAIIALSDAATLAVTANGDLFQGLRKADSFQTQHVDTLFSLVPPELDGDDLFSVLHPEWT